jgi:hypothetical protein
MPPHSRKIVESNPCTQSLPACFELRSTARAAKLEEWPANQAGRREQGVAGLLGVGHVFLICSWGEEIRNTSPTPRFLQFLNLLNLHKL